MDIAAAAILYLSLHPAVPRVDFPRGYYQSVPGSTKEYWQTMQPSSLIHMGTKTYILNVDGTMSPLIGF